MALSRIDELNKYSYVYSDAEVDNILKEYFDIMEIDEDQKEKRVKVAKDFRNTLLFLFSLIPIAEAYEQLSYEYILSQFRLEYAKVLVEYGRVDQHMQQYFEKVTSEIVDNTLRHYNPEALDYWLSDERAILIAENEANSVYNYSELQDAIDEGYTEKEWITERDDRVRKTHRAVDRKRIPIDDYFEFPDCRGLYPHDEVNLNEEELVNCRCSCKFY